MVDTTGATWDTDLIVMTPPLIAQGFETPKLWLLTSRILNLLTAE